MSRISTLSAYLKLISAAIVFYKVNQRDSEGNARWRVRIFGYTIDAQSPSQVVNLFEEIFAYESYSAFLQNGSSPVIVDCGSNIGLSILYFKKLFPESRIIGFEPDPGTFNTLQQNILDNKLKNVESHQVALSDDDSQSKLYSKPSGPGSLTMSLFEGEGKTQTQLVPTRRLSTYIDSAIDLLKIDVEGAEVKIINDLIDSKKLGFISQMIIEYHPTITGKPVEEFVRLLESQSFSCNCEKDVLHPGATELMVRAVKN